MKVSRMIFVAASLAVSVLLAQQVQAAELFAGRHQGTQLGRIDTTGPTGTTIGSPGVTINSLAYDAASDTLYGTTGAPSTSGLHVLNQTDGSITSTVDVSLSWITALAWDNNLNTLWGNGGGGINKIDPSNGDTSDFVSVTPRIDGLAYGNGTLWGLDETGPVFAINTSNGNTTLLADLGLPSTGAGLAYDVDTDRLYVGTVNVPTILLEVNPNDGTFTSLGTVTGGIGRTDALAPTVIPEPASLALLGLGGLMMLRRRRA